MDLLDRLLRHDAWTTRLLLERCATLTDDQLDQEFDIGHRSLRKTMWHIVGNVEVWGALMAGASERLRPSQPDLDGWVDQLLLRHDAASRQLAEVARGVADRHAWDERWLDILDDPPVEKTYGGAIAHVVTHSMHHRAQVLYMLKKLGLDDLPEGDVLSWEHSAGVRGG